MTLSPQKSNLYNEFHNLNKIKSNLIGVVEFREVSGELDEGVAVPDELRLGQRLDRRCLIRLSAPNVFIESKWGNIHGFGICGSAERFYEKRLNERKSSRSKSIIRSKSSRMMFFSYYDFQKWII